MNPCPKCGGENLRKSKYACNECSKAYERDRWAKLPQKKQREKWLKFKYNLSYEDYKQMYTNQNGKCKICSNSISITSKKNSRDTACVDHCHTTGRVRGLLCNHCNRGLGIFKDNPKIIKKALEYIIDSHNNK